MMSQYRVIPGTLGLAESLLAQPLRQVDVDEWVGASGAPVPQSLRRAVANPDSIVRAMVGRDGVCICMWGVTRRSEDSRIGAVWLLAAQAAEAQAKLIHRHWHEELHLMENHTPFLMAFVYERNSLHKRWLRTIGFTRMAVASPIAGYRFYHRYKRDNNNV